MMGKIRKGFLRWSPTAEGSEGRVMIGSAMVAYSVLKHDIGDLGWILTIESMAAGSDG